MKLSDAIAEYISSRSAQGYAANTNRATQQALDLLLAEVGNLRVRSINVRHGEAFVAAMHARGFKPGTVNLYRGSAVRFFKWCHQRKYLPGNSHPMATTRNVTNSAPPRRRVDAVDFPRLLDCCDHPQTRIVVALGLYLFLRASEVAALKVSDARLDRGEIQVWVEKVRRWDVMPICEELDTELRRWLEFYAADQAAVGRALDPDWPLVPARQVSQLFGRHPAPSSRPGGMNPRRRVGHVHEKAKDALTAFGWAVGPGDREGVHTLRRSGARALFDELVDSGRVRDGALRVVQAMLHHKSVTMTELYLGLEADREKRDDLFRGKAMFRRPAGVTVLAQARE